METDKLIAECTAYDFKVMLEEKKPKSWLKSVSAFANGQGGSLFFGIDNKGEAKGLDIYDDRLTVTSPGGMYNGTLIQDLDIASVSSVRRNPVLADVMAQLDYMEKRGSGLRRICRETKALEGYQDNLQPLFNSTPTQFQTTIYALSDMDDVGRNVGDQTHCGTRPRNLAENGVAKARRQGQRRPMDCCRTTGKRNVIINIE